MKVAAPGKLVLTGAYAVLRGAPAIVMAVDRYVVAETASPDDVDVTALHDADGRKLGLGSSAASLVASEAARAVVRGESLGDADVRSRVFRVARAAHARQQSGGSGVDIAAAVYGGLLRYTLDGERSSIEPFEWPRGLVVDAFFSGSSARTSDLRARVDALGAHDVFRTLGDASHEAARTIERGDAGAFVRTASAFGRALEALGAAADAPIVSPAFAELGRMASAEDGAFLPSGAGGGDMAVWLGLKLPPQPWLTRAEALGMRRLELHLDRAGVRIDGMAT